MIMRNKRLCPMLVFSLLLFSCSKGIEKVENLSVGDDLAYLYGVELDYDHVFFDDFSDGVDASSWYIADQAWGGGNGGVIPKNVAYSDDGILILKGNGNYYLDGEVKGVGDVKDGRLTGSALISKFTVGPGHYEIKMKVNPRLGACSAFWTFAYDHSDNSNHEIDIELPGGSQKGLISFENVLNTNYQTEENRISQDVKVSELLGEEETFLNDGRWHTFGFDWYTDPAKVVYTIDHKVTAVADYFVPYKASRLWVGNWFPVSSSFVGSADFETDQMLVDYIQYIPFLNQEYEDFVPEVNGVASENLYPSKPVTIRKINKIANGDFEFETSQIDLSGWTFNRFINEDQEIDMVAYLAEGEGTDSSQALAVKDGGVVRQTIDGVYSTFTHDFALMAKGKGKVIVNYYATMTTEVLKQYEIDVDSEEYQKYEIEITAPKETQKMRIQIQSSQGNSIYVDDVELYQK